MTENNQTQLGNTLWRIADELRGAMNADQFRDYMLSFLFLRYLSDNYEAAAKKELGKDYPVLDENDNQTPLAVWYKQNKADVAEFEKQMRRKVHYVIEPSHLWNSIAELAKTQSKELLRTLQEGFKYIENESFEDKDAAVKKLQKSLPKNRISFFTGHLGKVELKRLIALEIEDINKVTEISLLQR